MSDHRADLGLLRSALAAARDGLIHEADLDPAEALALCRWLTPHGSADAPYWPLADIEALLGGCPD